jgi:hypothetical protein
VLGHVKDVQVVPLVVKNHVSPVPSSMITLVLVQTLNIWFKIFSNVQIVIQSVTLVLIELTIVLDVL